VNSYPTCSAVGSNKIVVNPASGGASQRLARARSSATPSGAASSSTRARWTVRWSVVWNPGSPRVERGLASDFCAMLASVWRDRAG